MWCKSLEVLNPYEALKEANMTDLKPCPFCGGMPVKNVMASFSGSIYIATVKCEKCGITKKLAYSPRKINKPKNAEATALRLAGKEWNRRVEEEEKHETD